MRLLEKTSRAIEEKKLMTAVRMQRSIGEQNYTVWLEDASGRNRGCFAHPT